jgi:hypothetical protein
VYLALGGDVRCLSFSGVLSSGGASGCARPSRRRGSNLHLRPNQHSLVVSSEHRAVPVCAMVYLKPVTTDVETNHLDVIGELQDGSTKFSMDGKQRSLEQRVLDLLGQDATLTRAKLRDSLGVKNERLGEALEGLERAGRLCRTPAGWQRRNGSIEGGRSRSL